jgi:hypothetical protein
MDVSRFCKRNEIESQVGLDVLIDASKQNLDGFHPGAFLVELFCNVRRSARGGHGKGAGPALYSASNV